MMTSSDLASAPCDPLVPFTDQLRLAVAAHLARFKGSSRENTESDLRCYLAWCAERGLDPLAAKRPHLDTRADPAQQPRRPDGPARGHPPPAPARRDRRHPDSQGAPAHAPPHVCHYQFRRRHRPPRRADRRTARRPAHHDALRPGPARTSTVTRTTSWPPTWRPARNPAHVSRSSRCGRRPTLPEMRALPYRIFVHWSASLFVIQLAEVGLLLAAQYVTSVMLHLCLVSTSQIGFTRTRPCARG